MEIKHTSTPWRQSGHKIVNGGREIARCNGARITPLNQQLANAAFIVCACNAHGELVASLKVLRARAGGHIQGVSDVDDALLARVDNMLAQVEGR